MKTFGLSNDYQVATVGEFCYSIPDGKTGKIETRTIVHEGDQNFLLVKRSDWADLYIREQGDMNRVGAKICQGNSAFLKEPLIATGKAKQSSYDLSMSISHTYSDDFVYAVITSCKNITNVEYSISFENPGSFRRRSFSCQDIGLLETYFWLVCLVALVAYKILFPVYKRLKQEEAMPSGSPLAVTIETVGTASIDTTSRMPYLGQAPHVGDVRTEMGEFGGQQTRTADLIWPLLISTMSGLSILCQFTHLLVYSQDGMGLKALSYLGELMETAAGCLLIGQALPVQLTIASATYLTLFFLWTQTTYKNQYVQRIRTGKGLGDFGLSVYSPLFGTRLGIFTVLVRAGLGASLLINIQKRNSRRLWADPDTRNHALHLAYFLTPVMLVLSPIKWKHCEIIFMTLSLLLPPIRKIPPFVQRSYQTLLPNALSFFFSINIPTDCSDQLLTPSRQATRETSKDTVFIEESSVLYETI